MTKKTKLSKPKKREQLLDGPPMVLFAVVFLPRSGWDQWFSVSTSRELATEDANSHGLQGLPAKVFRYELVEHKRAAPRKRAKKVGK